MFSRTALQTSRLLPLAQICGEMTCINALLPSSMLSVYRQALCIVCAVVACRAMAKGSWQAMHLTVLFCWLQLALGIRSVQATDALRISAFLFGCRTMAKGSWQTMPASTSEQQQKSVELALKIVLWCTICLGSHQPAANASLGSHRPAAYACMLMCSFTAAGTEPLCIGQHGQAAARPRPP
jgi:hypothetical protein